MEGQVITSQLARKRYGDLSPHDLLESYNFDIFPNSSEADAGAQINMDTGLNITLAGSQDVDYGFGPQYNPSVPMAYPVVEADNLLASHEFGEKNAMHKIPDTNYQSDYLHVPNFDEIGRLRLDIAGRSFPTFTPMVNPKDYAMRASGAQERLITPVFVSPPLARGRSIPLIPSTYQDLARSLPSIPQHGQFVGFPYTHSYQTYPLLRDHNYYFPSILDYNLGVDTHSVKSYPPFLYSSTNGRTQPLEQSHNDDALLWNPLIGSTPSSGVGTHYEWFEDISTQTNPPRPRFEEDEMLLPIGTSSNSFPSPIDIGISIPRTSSPETIEHDGLDGSNMGDVDSGSPTCRRKRIYQRGSEPEVPSTQSSSSSLSSSDSSCSVPCLSVRQKSNGDSKTKIGVRSRLLTEDGKQNALDVRRNGGACIPCRRLKKQCKVNLPCDGCRKLAGPQSYLCYALCYRGDFEKALSKFQDMFGIEERKASIKAELKSLHGLKRPFHLGHGLKLNSNIISIDINPSRILSVEIQDTNPELRQPCILTESGREDKFFMEIAMKKSYAITLESLPSISELEDFGRQDIEERAAKDWLNDLEAGYDLALLRYCKNIPPLRYHGIVQDTVRIISLGKFLDSRRPIDHDECMEFLQSCVTKPPAQFGIKESNRCKAKFQLSMTARTQLYICAAQGIIDSQRELGQRLDAFFTQRKDHVDTEFIVGACLRRLGLEYRQRLERYHCFPSSLRQLHGRIERCNYMYTLFTRLYQLWYDGGTLPLPPGWSEKTLEHNLGYDDGLVDIFSKLRVLELEFSKSRLNENDKFYKNLIIDRAERKESPPERQNQYQFCLI